jgi:hypothetical protein
MLENVHSLQIKHWIKTTFRFCFNHWEGSMRPIILTILCTLCASPTFAQTQQTANEQVSSILEQIKKKATLKLSTTTVQNSIDAADYEAKRLATVTVAASIDEAAANAIIGDQLNKDKTFHNPKFKFAGQTVDGTIEYSGSLSIPVIGPLKVNAVLHAALATAVDLVVSAPTDEFKVGFAVTALSVDSLKFTSTTSTPPNFVNDSAEAVINTLLLPAQTLLNHVELRIPTTVAGRINLKVNPSPGLTVTFDPDKLNVGLQVVGITHLVDRGRLTLAAQVEGTLNAVPAKPNNVAFQTFRDDFQKLIAEKAAWINQSQISTYVDRQFLRSLVSKTLGAGPICMQAKMDKAVVIHTKLKLPPLESIDCTPTTDCTPKRDCTPTTDCSQHDDCSACILRNPFGGCSIRGNDPICEARKVANKGTCETNKSVQKGQCEAEKSAEKAKCEAGKSGEKAACEGLKESYKRFRATGADYANIDSDDLHLSGGGNLCLNQIAFNPDQLSLTATLGISVIARADGHIKFTPLNVAGHLTCFAPFTEPLGLTAQIPTQSIGIDTSAKFIDDSTQVSIEANFSNPVHIRFPFASIAANLAGDPKFTIFCPVPGAAMKLRATTPDSWWPREARGDVDRDLPDLRFDIDLVQKPIKAGNLEIAGKLRSNKAGIGGVFTLNKASQDRTKTARIEP